MLINLSRCALLRNHYDAYESEWSSTEQNKLNSPQKCSKLSTKIRELKMKIIYPSYQIEFAREFESVSHAKSAHFSFLLFEEKKRTFLLAIYCSLFVMQRVYRAHFNIPTIPHHGLSVDFLEQQNVKSLAAALLSFSVSLLLLHVFIVGVGMKKKQENSS